VRFRQNGGWVKVYRSSAAAVQLRMTVRARCMCSSACVCGMKVDGYFARFVAVLCVDGFSLSAIPSFFC
jgi:hypothetical protein